LEVYSIDESFLRVDGVVHLYDSPTSMGLQIKYRVKDWVGLPVCVGIAPSKTLAKFANYLAKHYSSLGGVCDISSMSQNDLFSWMSEVDVGEWLGVVGRYLTS